jgi:hypothetical protein
MTSSQLYRHFRTVDGAGKSRFHGWPELPRGPSHDTSTGSSSNSMTGFSRISAYRGSTRSKKR